MSSAPDFVDVVALARDVSRLVRVPSVTGDERAAAAELVAIARTYGLDEQRRAVEAPPLEREDPLQETW